MGKMTLPSPLMIIKDNQSKENIRWEDCRLLLNIGPKQIQLGLFQQPSGYFIRLVDYVFEGAIPGDTLKETIDQIIELNDIAVARCGETRIMAASPLFVSIPSDLDQEELREAFFSFLFQKEAKRSLLKDAIPGQGLKIVYSLDSSFLDALKEKFQSLKTVHCTTIQLKREVKKMEDSPQIILSMHPGFIFLTVFVDHKLQMIQPFKANKPLDAVYFVLNAVREWRLEEASVKLFLTGYHPEEQLIFDELEAYYQSVKWLERPEGFLYPSAMENYPSYSFYHLVSLATCEL